MAKKTQLGALWNRTTKDGNKFMTGKLKIGEDKIDVVVFSNNYKDPDKEEDKKKPDAIIYEAEPKNEAPTKKQNNDDGTPF